jgi:hypothetical protein
MALRACDLCGGVDEGSRHIFHCETETPGAVPDGGLIRTAIMNGATDEAIDQLLDPTTLVRHMECCRDAGCADCAETNPA